MSQEDMLKERPLTTSSTLTWLLPSVSATVDVNAGWSAGISLVPPTMARVSASKASGAPAQPPIAAAARKVSVANGLRAGAAAEVASGIGGVYIGPLVR